MFSSIFDFNVNVVECSLFVDENGIIIVFGIILDIFVVILCGEVKCVMME